MNETDMQKVLQAVASGALTPEEAASLLEGDSATTAAPGPGPDPTRELPRPQPEAADAVRRVRVHANAGTVRITGDDTVAELVVEGSHTMHRTSDSVVVECTPLLDGFGFDEPVGAYASVASRGSHSRRRLKLGFLGGDHQPVRIRMNPALELDVELVAGSLSIDGVDGPIRAEVSAGSATIKGVRAPIDCSVSAGSASISGRFDNGRSRVSCDMGAATVRLDPGSDVRVTASTTMGRCDIRLTRGADSATWVLGSGQAELAVHGTMSSVSVAPSDS